MAFSVNEMLSTINANGGISRASKFMVNITPPASMAESARPDLRFFCESAQLPGLAFQLDDVKMTGYGTSEKRPHNAVFGDMPLTFYNDTDGNVLRFFHKWFQTVYNFNSGDNPLGTTRDLPINTFAYPKDYWGTITINHYDDIAASERSDTPPTVVSYTLYQAFPIAMQDVLMSWDSSDTLVRIPLSFAYKYWKADTMEPGSVDARSRARATSLSNIESAVDEDLKRATELLNVEKAQLQYQTNYYAQYLSYY
jgi:hypothetical protein